MHMSRMFSGTTPPLWIAPFGRFILLLVSLGLIGGLGANGWLFPAQSQAALPSAFIEGFSEIVEKVRPAVVNVAVTGGGGSSKPIATRAIWRSSWWWWLRVEALLVVLLQVGQG